LALGRQSLGGVGDEGTNALPQTGALARLSDPETSGTSTALLVVTQALSGDDLIGEGATNFVPLFQTALSSLETAGERAVQALEEVGDHLVRLGREVAREVWEAAPLDSLFAGLGAEDTTPPPVIAVEPSRATEVAAIPVADIEVLTNGTPRPALARTSLLTRLGWATAALGGGLLLVGSRRLRGRRKIAAVGKA
jgi:hypothetical protein